ncbi:MAG: hypothetical protein ACI4L9_00115 [Candidatus Coproplasma sp.]
MSDEIKTAPSGELVRLGGKLTVSLIVGLISYTILCIIFLCGPFTLFGNNVSMIGAINCALEIFSITSLTVYKSLANLVMGIAYFIVFVILIKNSFTIIKHFSKLTSKNNKQKLNDFSYLMKEIFKSFNIVYFLIILSYLLSGDTLNTGAGFSIAIGILCFTINTILNSIDSNQGKDKFNWLDYICQVMKSIVFYLMILCLLFSVAEPVGSNLNYSLQILFNGIFEKSNALSTISSVYVLLFKSILNAIIILQVYLSMNKIIGSFAGISTTSSDLYDSNCYIARKLKIILILLCISLLCNLIFESGIIGNKTMLTSSDILNWLRYNTKEYLPKILLSVAGILVAQIITEPTIYKPKAKTKQPSVKNTTV